MPKSAAVAASSALSSAVVWDAVKNHDSFRVTRKAASAGGAAQGAGPIGKVALSKAPRTLSGVHSFAAHGLAQAGTVLIERVKGKGVTLNGASLGRRKAAIAKLLDAKVVAPHLAAAALARYSRLVAAAGTKASVRATGRKARATRSQA